MPEEYMSDEEYITLGSSACPVCRSTNIGYDSLDCDGKYMSQPVECEDCHSTWYDIYKLEGYADLDVHGKTREAELQALEAWRLERLAMQQQP